RPAIDRELHERDIRDGIEVPAIARGFLVVPCVMSGIGIDRDDGGDEQIVAAILGAEILIPGIAVAGAEVELVEVRVVDDRIPDVAAASMAIPVPEPGRPRLASQ